MNGTRKDVANGKGRSIATLFEFLIKILVQRTVETFLENFPGRDAPA